MKKILFTTVIFFFSLITLGQNSISIGPQLGFPSNFSSSTKTGVGGSLEYVNKFSEHLGARAYFGYDYFKGKYPGQHVYFLPARAGLNIFLADLLFINGDAGIAGYHDNNNTSHSGFSYGFGAGYRIPLGLSKQFAQVSFGYNSFRYNDVLAYTWFTLRLAYGLNFGIKTSVEK